MMMLRRCSVIVLKVVFEVMKEQYEEKEAKECVKQKRDFHVENTDDGEEQGFEGEAWINEIIKEI